jgi:hypothetical protein
MKLHLSKFVLFVLLAVVLLIPMAASAKSPQAAHERPLEDFFWDDLNVHYYCPPSQQVPFVQTLMPWDFTTAWDLLPKGYYLAFRSYGMLPDPQGSMSFCDLDLWQYNTQLSPPGGDAGTMTGQIIERPLRDGTAMIHVTLHYDNLPFRVYQLDNILSACISATTTCNTDLYTPVVVDGRMSVKMTWDFAILDPEGGLTFDNIDWSVTGQNSATGQGVGTFTGADGFPAGKQAAVKLTGVCNPGRAVGNPHWDGCPAENIKITVRK